MADSYATYFGDRQTSGTVPPDQGPYNLGDAVVLALNVGNLEKTGFLLAGWKIQWETDVWTPYALGASFLMPDHDSFTVFADWRTPLTVTYDGNGADSGSPPVDANEYLSGANATILGVGTLIKSGYRLTGWNTQADGLGTHYAIGGTKEITEDVTLYAEWTLEWTVTYEDIDATSGTAPVDPEGYIATESAVVLANTGRLRKSGHVVEKWQDVVDSIRTQDGMEAWWKGDAWSCAYEYPDDPAGTTQLITAFTAAECPTGWSISVSPTFGLDGDDLIIYASARYSQIYRSVTSKMVRIKVEAVQGLWMLGVAGVSNTSITGPGIYDYLVSGTASVALFQNEADYSGDYIKISMLYLGTGLCLQPLADDSGNGRPGTVYGCTSVAGVSGNALAFNGVDARVNFATKYTGTGAFSFACFVEGKTRTAVQYIYTRDAGGAGGRGIRIYLDANNRPVMVISEDGTATSALTADAGSACTADCGLLFVFDPGVGMYIYKNGTLIKSTTTSVPAMAFYSAAQTESLGSLVLGSFFDGWIDDARPYGRVNSADEAAWIYAHPGENPIDHAFGSSIAMTGDVTLYPKWSACTGEYVTLREQATARGIWTPTTAGTKAKALADAAEAIRLFCFGTLGTNGPISIDNLADTYTFASEIDRLTFVQLWNTYDIAAVELRVLLKNTSFPSLATAQAAAIAGDTFIDSSLQYRATVDGALITVANSTRLTPKRYADVADSTARGLLTGMIIGDTTYQTSPGRWYVYKSTGWDVDGPEMTAAGIGARDSAWKPTWTTDFLSTPASAAMLIADTTPGSTGLWLSPSHLGFYDATATKWLVWLGVETGVGKLYAGNGATDATRKSISWDGTDLWVHGNLKIGASGHIENADGKIRITADASGGDTTEGILLNSRDLNSSKVTNDALFSISSESDSGDWRSFRLHTQRWDGAAYSGPVAYQQFMVAGAHSAALNITLYNNDSQEVTLWMNIDETTSSAGFDIDTAQYRIHETSFYIEADGTVDIGTTAHRWKDLFLSGDIGSSSYRIDDIFANDIDLSGNAIAAGYVSGLYLAATRGLSRSGAVAYSDVTDENTVFDWLNTYIPTTNDARLARGIVSSYEGGSYYARHLTSVFRTDASTITLYGTTSDGTDWSKTLTNGSTNTALNKGRVEV